jgi:hypothetical protein
MPTIEMVVLFLLLAVLIFSLLPSTLKLIKKKSTYIYICISLVIWTIESMTLFSLDKTLFFVYEFLMVLLMLLGPYLYVQMQGYKKALNGPWDIR